MAVIGPHISDNAVAVRGEIERRFRVPTTGLGRDDDVGAVVFLVSGLSNCDRPHLARRRGAAASMGWTTPDGHDVYGVS